MRSIFSQPIRWMKADDAFHPYTAIVDGVVYRIRLNDFPQEKLYTLLHALDEPAVDFDEWPALWQRE